MQVAGVEKCQCGEQGGWRHQECLSRKNDRPHGCPPRPCWLPPASLPSGDRAVPCGLWPAHRIGGDFSCLFDTLACPSLNTPTRRCRGHTHTWVSYLSPRDFRQGHPLGECGGSRHLLSSLPRVCCRCSTRDLGVGAGAPLPEPGGGKMPRGGGPRAVGETCAVSARCAKPAGPRAGEFVRAGQVTQNDTWRHLV